MPSTNDSPKPDRETAGWLAVEAERLASEGRLAESERLLGRLLALQEQAVAGRELDLAETLGMRGEVRFLSNDVVGAEDDFRRALAVRERCLGRRHPETASSLCSLALVLWRRGARTEAEPLLSRCLDIRRSLLGKDHPETQRTLSRLRRLWHELTGTEEDAVMTLHDESEGQPDFSGTAILAEWSALRDRFGELSRRLLDAARGDKTLSPEAVVQELTDCRLGFQRLCDEARGWADAFQVSCPPAAQLENLLGIAAFLDQIGEAVLNQERTERPRRRALLVLDQVQHLAHAVEPECGPLQACQERSRALYQRLADGDDANQDELRPFYDLLLLAHQRNTVSDDAWLRLHQSVSASFGKALAAAASRGHLIAAQAVVPRAQAGPAPAVLQPRFARAEDDYVIPLATAALQPVPGAPPVIQGPLSVRPYEVGATRNSGTRTPSSAVRFRTADGKLYTLMPGEPVVGPKGLDVVIAPRVRE